jgi:hypothetical protein
MRVKSLLVMFIPLALIIVSFIIFNPQALTWPIGLFLSVVCGFMGAIAESYEDL